MKWKQNLFSKVKAAKHQKMQVLHKAKFTMNSIKKEVHSKAFNALCNFIDTVMLGINTQWHLLIHFID